MAQSDLHTELSEVHQKLKRLLDKHSALQKEHNRLLLSFENAQQQITEKDEQIKLLMHQAALIKSGIQQWHPDQRKLFVKRIDTYLKEIEKCLALINE